MKGPHHMNIDIRSTWIFESNNIRRDDGLSVEERKRRDAEAKRERAKITRESAKRAARRAAAKMAVA